MRVQGSQANGGGGYTRYTRGLITGEAGLYKIPGVSSPGRYMKVPSPQHARMGP